MVIIQSRPEITIQFGHMCTSWNPPVLSDVHALLTGNKTVLTVPSHWRKSRQRGAEEREQGLWKTRPLDQPATWFAVCVTEDRAHTCCHSLHIACGPLPSVSSNGSTDAYPLFYHPRFATWILKSLSFEVDYVKRQKTHQVALYYCLFHGGHALRGSPVPSKSMDIQVDQKS